MTGAETVVNVALVIVPMIIIAECFSWYAVVTTNFLYNAIENSLWAVTFFLTGIALCRLMPEFQGPVRVGPHRRSSASPASSPFSHRRRADVSQPLAGRRRATSSWLPREGLHDVATRWVVTHDIAHWKGELTWMSLYFTARSGRASRSARSTRWSIICRRTAPPLRSTARRPPRRSPLSSGNRHLR